MTDTKPISDRKLKFPEHTAAEIWYLANRGEKATWAETEIDAEKFRQILAWMDAYAAPLREEVERLTRERDGARRGLESLTPSGSEFVNDVPRCVEYIRRKQESQHQAIVTFKLRADKAGQENAAAHTILDSAFADHAKDSTCATCRDHSVGYRAARLIELMEQKAEVELEIAVKSLTVVGQENAALRLDRDADARDWKQIALAFKSAAETREDIVKAGRALAERVSALTEALRKIIDTKLERECGHGEEWDYCDGCLYAWQKELSAARSEAAALLAGETKP